MPNDSRGPTPGPGSDSTTSSASPSRERLIEAAARIYAACGFRGATTRRIAEEAGVNEVTIFRLFGSKALLIEEAVRHSGAAEPVGPGLPEEPVDPERELAGWCARVLTELRERGAVLRQLMGEVEENPGMAPCAGQAAAGAGRELKRYVCALYEHRFLHGGASETGRNEEAHAAGAMLVAALFGDAVGRDLTPDLYPQPAERAPALYAGMFLRALRYEPRPPR